MSRPATVDGWLTSLGLGQYASLFAEQEIGVSELPSLTDGDLQQIGVAPLGHRKRLLKAIASLADIGAHRPTRADLGADGELKFVTLLFADIVDSTRIVQHLDPETAEATLAPYLAAAVDAVRLHSGTLVRELGDGLMAVFGAPRAIEDHARLACEAGLAIHEAARELALRSGPSAPSIRLRVGINSGEVVARIAGDRVEALFGPVVHLAARVEQSSAPGTVRLARDTARLVEGVFALDALEPMAVKGMDQPAECYEIVGRISDGGNLGRRLRQGLTRYIGRRDEMARLSDAVGQVRRGRGRSVAICGGPGVGKSRLVHEFLASPALDGFRILRGESRSYGHPSQYRPIVDLLAADLGLARGMAASERAERARDAIADIGPHLAHFVVPLLTLLGAPSDDAGWDELEPVERHLRTVEAICALLLAQGKRTPLAIALEDLQWADEGTRAVLDALVRRLDDVPVLLLVTYRPEFDDAWRALPSHILIPLAHLDDESAGRLLDALLVNRPSPEIVKARLIDITAGNPLFIEESVRALLDRGGAGAGDRRFQQLLETTAIPASIQSIIAARVDGRTPQEKLILQAASVIGMELPVEHLAALVDARAMNLADVLRELEAADFIYLARTHPDREYRFKHALTREAVYRQLLKGRRRELHAKYMAILEARLGFGTDARFDLLSYHAQAGGLAEKGSQYATEHGDRLARGHANEAAAAAYESALTSLSGLVRTDEVDRQRAAILLKLGSIYLLLLRAGDAYDRFRTALELADAVGDARMSIAARNRLGGILGHRCEVTEAENILGQALALARQHADVSAESTALHLLGSMHMGIGRLQTAYEYYSHAAEIAERQKNIRGIAVEGTLICCALIRMGRPEDAGSWGRRALEVAEAMGDERRVAWAALMLAQAHNLRAEFVESGALLARAREIVLRYGDMRGGAWAATWSASRAAMLGDYTGATAEYLRVAEVAKRSGGYKSETAFVLGRAAECELRQGKTAEAWTTCQECLAIAEPLGIRIEIGYARIVLAQLRAEAPQRDFAAALALAAAAREILADVGAMLDVGLADLAAARIEARCGERAAALKKARDTLAWFRDRGGLAYAEETQRFMATLTT